tara:strand:+ start:2653 stop:3669 length:1017 start_codon:yes stop_codon:yes gene_type:complete
MLNKNKLKEYLTNTGPKTLIKIKKFVRESKAELDYKSFGHLNKDKIFYVIRRYPSAGLFSNITFVLNHLRLSDEANFIPIIDMENYPSLYNENKIIKKTKNSWEYYFENLNKYSLKEVYKSKNVFLSNLVFEKDMSINITDKKIKNYLNKIKIKKNILKKTKIFEKNFFFKKDKILGIHFRGSTYKNARGHAFPLTPQLMIKNINFLLKKFKYNKIFIVTEEDKYLKILQKEFKDICISYPSFRMNNIDSFKIYPRMNHRYLLGEEILIETLLLSKCDGLTFIKSNVISAAINFSKKKQNLHETFLGLNSRNRFVSKYLWKIKSKLPSSLGGLSLKYK